MRWSLEVAQQQPLVVYVLMKSCCAPALPPVGALQGAFLLSIVVELKPDAKQAFLEKWTKLAHHVKEHEPGTLAYEALQFEENPNKLLIHERCAQTQDRVKTVAACWCSS